MKHFLPLALVVFSLLGYSQTNDHPDGEIRGIVTDQNGSPVPAATVYAVPQDITFDRMTPRSIKTNRDGEFDFHGAFQTGTYKIFSRKDEDGYPDLSDSFYADSKANTPKVDLTEDHPSATVTVTLGDKAGVLVGRAIDADSDTALEAKLVFMDEDGNNHSVLVKGNYRVLLPSGKDVTLMVMVMSPDYRSQVPFSPLRLEPGQEMQMDIPVTKQ